MLPFAIVLLVGAPYLPTRRAQANQALDMMRLKKGDVFVDLGSGDGVVLIEAAKRGYRCYGYELNPFVWAISKVRTVKYGEQITIYCRNYWREPIPEGTKGVFVFLLEKYMAQLDKKLSQELSAGTPVVSYTFQIPKKEAIKAEGALYLYKY